MSKWEKFLRNIQQDIKLYLFICTVLCLFRISFIGILHQYLSESTTLKDIGIALYYGARLSLKSAGAITLLSFLFCTVLGIFIKSNRWQSIRLGLGYVYICVLSILFQARIPYYEQFHMAFSVFIFNTFRDDTVALFYTLVQQYHLVVRLLVAFIIAFLLCKGLRMILTTRTYPMPQFSRWYHKMAFRTALLLSIGLFMVFTRFGGSLTYGSGINWESAAKSKEDFLNEAILDDVQALYRAYSLNSILQSGKNLNISKEKIIEYGNYLVGHKVLSNNIDDFLSKEAQGAKVKKPKHIFLIVGESYAGWPLLPKYKDLNIANGMKSIIEQDNAIQVQNFLATSTSTMAGINGIITGMPEINLSPNYQSESYKGPYATAIAVQMRKLGYKNHFWYGGFSSWQRIKDFTLAQGFDEFHGSSDWQSQGGNAWGSEDKYFLNAISATFKDEQPTFNVILTTSNHPPYTVDLKQEDFDGDNVVGGLPDKLKSDQEWIEKLGHFWYADKVLAMFLKEMYRKYPDSLFIITGDHADRMNIEASPTLFDRYAVPLIIYGQGVNKQLLSSEIAGSHIDISPTLLELIAPQGFTYYSVGETLTRTKKLGINDHLWITPNYIGRIEEGNVEALNWASSTATPPSSEILKQEIDAIRAVSWWRIARGKNIE
jgi:phosphoglycerol transferase MdoB-like AlkP superfamily enzyme